MKSEEIRAQLRILEEKFKRAEAERDYWYDQEEEAQKRLAQAEDYVEGLEEEIYDLEEELEELLREEEAGDQAELERYYAARDKRQEDLDL